MIDIASAMQGPEIQIFPGKDKRKKVFFILAWFLGQVVFESPPPALDSKVPWTLLQVPAELFH